MANFKTEKLNRGLIGEIEIPADKSISHRSLIIGSLTKGKMKIENFSTAEDCTSTLKILVELGAKIEQNGNTLLADFSSCYKAPKNILDCGNSGTTMRLMSGILSAQNFTSTLCGDESLTKRPMKRVIEPLSLMGAKIESNENINSNSQNTIEPKLAERQPTKSNYEDILNKFIPEIDQNFDADQLTILDSVEEYVSDSAQLSIFDDIIQSEPEC